MSETQVPPSGAAAPEPGKPEDQVTPEQEGAEQVPDDGGEGTLYSITDFGDDAPWAVVHANRGIYRQWIPGTGWVDMPYFATYFGGGESGAREITAEEAEAIKATVYAPPAAVQAIMSGSAEGNSEADPFPREFK